MQNSRHQIIKEIYDNLLLDKAIVQKLLDDNLFYIERFNVFLSSPDKSEVPEYSVFSPRGMENDKNDNLEMKMTKIRSLELENKVYVEQLNRIYKNIFGLNELLSSLDKEEKCVRKETGGYLGVLNIQEEERQRIARDLHDSSLQNLTHLIHKLELTSMYIDSDPLKAKLELASTNKNLKGIIEDVRNTIFELRPMSFDDLGLKEAFERLFVNLKEANPEIDFKTEIEQLEGGRDIILMAIFRMIKECCVNAVKHSMCNKLYLSVKTEAQNCAIFIRDNGIGFCLEEANEKSDKHFGLCLIREQVDLLKGKIDIQSDINSGTNIRIDIPVEIIRGN